MKRVLVTGGGGFIGKHAIDCLARRGYEVHATLHAGDSPGELEAVWHEVDLLDVKAVDVLLADIKPSHLLHLAWYTNPLDYRSSLENFRWTRAGIDITQSFFTHGGLRAVFAGTCAEYDWNAGEFVESRTPIFAQSPYSASKQLLDEFVEYYSRFSGLSYAWGRLFFLYGPHEKPGRLVFDAIESLLDNRIFKCRDGGSMRDYLYVGDAAEAFALLLESSATGAFNIASGTAVSIREILGKISQNIGGEGLIEYDQNPSPGESPGIIRGSIDRLASSTGWRPTTSLDEGIEKTVAWHRENRHRGDAQTSN